MESMLVSPAMSVIAAGGITGRWMFTLSSLDKKDVELDGRAVSSIDL